MAYLSRDAEVGCPCSQCIEERRRFYNQFEPREQYGRSPMVEHLLPAMREANEIQRRSIELAYLQTSPPFILPGKGFSTLNKPTQETKTMTPIETLLASLKNAEAVERSNSRVLKEYGDELTRAKANHASALVAHKEAAKHVKEIKVALLKLGYAPKVTESSTETWV